MYRYLIALSLLAACGNDAATTDNDLDSGAHPSHDMHANTYMDDAMAQTAPNPMRDMHQAMNTMMDSMHTYQPTGDADRDFAYLMRKHHQSAVEMAQAEISGGTDSSLVQLARTIVRDQQAEMNLFDATLQRPTASGKSAYGRKAMGMMSAMDKMEGGSVDHMFASMMIPHHKDGVKMANAYLKEGSDAGLMEVARNIVQTQPQEIKQLQQWLKAHR
ncbi:Uncharacterized conserved protein, DUF305 family [Cnuella takakiae]|uniref:Uncharacterized conserved protein, DUF305 family n=1 Tax=Cnuella takakiae TaxID=1302690 RepID=A0A1M5GYA7_9BACT|nr:DUF305 domain-containing protein [Cnuella takakiae]OLY90844.1 hypothetical protein BUE76_02240 [Cnuella takakiae]SHG08711.1 Uncharacterized conserved protein, DUF305 family [Cnuella takakiae]